MLEVVEHFVVKLFETTLLMLSSQCFDAFGEVTGRTEKTCFTILEGFAFW